MMFFSLFANKVVQKPNAATIVKDQRRLDACAMKPISGGPNKNPRKLIVETAANANCGDMVLDLPASAYTIGTTQDTPTPTSKQPTIANCNIGNTIITAKPDAIKIPLNCKIFFTPNFVISQSPMKRPVAIVAMNAT